MTDRVVDLVSEHADVTIRTGPIVDTSMTALKIAEYDRTICASPSYLRAHGTPPANPADLANHRCIAFSVPTARRWSFKAGNGIVHAEITPTVTTDSSDTVLRLALDGAGIVRLGDIMVSEPIRRGLLVPVLTDVHRPEPIVISAGLFRRASPASRKCGSFSTFSLSALVLPLGAAHEARLSHMGHQRQSAS